LKRRNFGDSKFERGLKVKFYESLDIIYLQDQDEDYDFDSTQTMSKEEIER